MKSTMKTEKKRILAVDDQASNTRMVKLSMERTNDYVVRELNDARTATRFHDNRIGARMRTLCILRPETKNSD